MKKKLLMFVMVSASLFAVAGCGKKEEKEPVSEFFETEEEWQTETVPSFADWLPQGITKLTAETDPYELLQQTIIEYYEIPEEYWGETKYYYNYVDLDGDKNEEVFAVAIGSYVSGSGGSSALWCQETEDGMKIRQAFTLVNMPILVQTETGGEQGTTAGALYLQRNGGGAGTEVVKLICENGLFTNVADAEAVESLEEVEGTAILYNDIIDDMEKGRYLTLADYE